VSATSGSELIIKLGDFGVSRMLSVNTLAAQTVVGTPYYMSPELVSGKPYNQKSDVWSVGCILYELLTGKRAFQGSSLPQVIFAIVKSKYPALPTTVSPGLRALTERMLQVQPNSRPTVAEVLSDAVLQDAVKSAMAKVGAASAAEAPSGNLTPPLSPPLKFTRQVSRRMDEPDDVACSPLPTRLHPLRDPVTGQAMFTDSVATDFSDVYDPAHETGDYPADFETACSTLLRTAPVNLEDSIVIRTSKSQSEQERLASDQKRKEEKEAAKQRLYAEEEAKWRAEAGR
ncbi:hypothetical protein CYMTET_24005, partial [Cymbomonas tetramitiformis]